MIKHITFVVCAFMLAIVASSDALITHQPAQASPNQCEFLIASIIEGQEYGHFSSREAGDLIDACIRETWSLEVE